MANFYPELPKIPYQRTSVEMGAVVYYLKNKKAPLEVRRAAYMIFRNESGNGKCGVNNNYGGIQADSGRWQPDALSAYFAGVSEQKENLTGKQRLFLCFQSYTSFLDFLIDKIQDKGLFIGGHTHDEFSNTYIPDIDTWTITYEKTWVMGNAHAVASTAELSEFQSLYNSACRTLAK